MLGRSFSVNSTDRQWEAQAALGAAEWQRLKSTWQVVRSSALVVCAQRHDMP